MMLKIKLINCCGVLVIAFWVWLFVKEKQEVVVVANRVRIVQTVPITA